MHYMSGALNIACSSSDSVHSLKVVHPLFSAKSAVYVIWPSLLIVSDNQLELILLYFFMFFFLTSVSLVLELKF